MDRIETHVPLYIDQDPDSDQPRLDVRVLPRSLTEAIVAESPDPDEDLEPAWHKLRETVMALTVVRLNAHSGSTTAAASLEDDDQWKTSVPKDWEKFVLDNLDLSGMHKGLTHFG